MTKILYRDDQNKMFLGVCKGVADYADVDVALVRVLAIVGLFFSFGMVFLVYIILALVVPAKSQLTSKTQQSKPNPPKGSSKKVYDEFELDPDDYKL